MPEMDCSSCGFDRARIRPAKIFQGREEGGLLPEDAVLSAELGAAPRVALRPAGRFAVPRGPNGGVTCRSQSSSRRGRAARPGEG